MLRVIFLFFFLAFELFAGISWTKEYIFHLKKDEIARILFIDRDKKMHEFKFRWTLYDGQKVIVLSNYKDFPKQHALYFDFRLNTIEQILLSETKKYYQKNSFFLLQMDRFDKKTKSISFLVFIKDDDQKFKIKFINPKQTRGDF